MLGLRAAYDCRKECLALSHDIKSHKPEDKRRSETNIDMSRPTERTLDSSRDRNPEIEILICYWVWLLTEDDDGADTPLVSP